MENDYIRLFLSELYGEDRRESLVKYQDDHVAQMLEAPGSSHNHQAWPGGYYDHILECLYIANSMYNSSYRELPFHKYSAFIVLYFHDIEKLFKYTGNPLDDKEEYLRNTLWGLYNIELTEEELDAIKYIHGEGDDYRKDKRIMSPLAAFCHCVDVMSARIWFDHPTHSHVTGKKNVK